MKQKQALILRSMLVSLRKKLTSRVGSLAGQGKMKKVFCIEMSIISMP
jgi:hypothetical protein